MEDQVKILDVIKIRNNNVFKINYCLREYELKNLLQPFKDKSIAVISVVGPARSGKSFLLNYMSRYLSNYNNNDWVGDKKEPLKGFHWKSDTEPQTSGIWLSKPYSVKRLDGKEIAVILMDTQGLFDAIRNRDNSTIVGLSVLLSSCLIFNITGDLQEDSLKSFDTILKYGMDSGKVHTEQSENKPFQNLFFTIRDWNTPTKYSYGIDGGKAYIEEKFKVQDFLAEEVIETKKLIKSCFKGIQCLLLPHIGQKALEENFDGSADLLNTRFSSNMKTLIEHLLSPQQIEIKLIKNKKLTCGQFIQYFQSYVELFNENQLPSPEDIISGNEKAEYLLKLEQIKNEHSKHLEKLIENKNFIPLATLESENEELKNKLIKDLQNFKYFEENEQKCEIELMENFQKCLKNIQTKIVEKVKQQLILSIKEYEKNIIDFMDTFESLESLEKQHKHLATQTISQFIVNCDVSDQSFIEPFKTKLNETMNQIFEKLKRNEIKKHQGIEREQVVTTESNKENLDDTDHKLGKIVGMKRNEYIYCRSLDFHKYLGNYSIKSKVFRNTESELNSMSMVTENFSPYSFNENLKGGFGSSSFNNEKLAVHRENSENIDELESLLKNILVDYKNKMESLMDENQYYSESSLETFHNDYKREALNKLNDQLIAQANSLELIRTYRNKSQRIIEVKYGLYCSINNERREKQDKFIEEQIKKFKIFYGYDMEGVLNSVECEEELIALHHKFELKYQKVLKTRNSNKDPELLLYYSERLKNQLKTSFFTFKAKCFNNETKKIITEAKKAYMKKIKSFIEGEQTPSKSELFDFHDKSRKHSLMFLDNEFSANKFPLNESYLFDLNKWIEVEFKRIHETIERNQQSVEKQLEHEVQEVSTKFEKYLINWIANKRRNI